MKDAETASSTNVPRHQVHWPIFQISHQRSRYVYELYYEKEAISKELYEWLLKNGYADAMLIAKWKKTGYEKVRLLPFASFYWWEDANSKAIVVLSKMRANEGDELQLDVYMSGTEGADEGGSGY